MATSLSGKKVLITGASSGIGAAIAQHWRSKDVWSGERRDLAKVATFPDPCARR